MVGYKEVKEIEAGTCEGCVFNKIKRCTHPEFHTVDELACDNGFIFVPDDQPQIKLISALDINLVDGLLKELIDICDEQGSIIRPSSGESIRDFILRLIYNQGKDE